LRVEERATADTLDAFEHLIPLPIKDLANPGVALVVRSSLERLVKAARSVIDVRGIPYALEEELDAALEPFADIAP
jgi:hypothetical protein